MSRAPNGWNLSRHIGKLLAHLDDIARGDKFPQSASELKALTIARCDKIEELVCAVCACVGHDGPKPDILAAPPDELMRLNGRLANISADMRATAGQLRQLAVVLKKSTEQLTLMQFHLFLTAGGTSPR